MFVYICVYRMLTWLQSGRYVPLSIFMYHKLSPRGWCAAELNRVWPRILVEVWSETCLGEQRWAHLAARENTSHHFGNHPVMTVRYHIFASPLVSTPVATNHSGDPKIWYRIWYRTYRSKFGDPNPRSVVAVSQHASTKRSHTCACTCAFAWYVHGWVSDPGLDE